MPGSSWPYRSRSSGSFVRTATARTPNG